ncbi:hypothetical protein AC579_144 [Pseudocercospora musae]|uniref:F-box domain-containing protein n=1 Tax=Pseudocercospora musae TaxID=113226 RepID=A0A139IM82_9PEZI|nr:hypothetical protein AC579_144 [Pseudocercospora musae]
MAFRNFVSSIRDKLPGKRRRDQARARAATIAPDTGITTVANPQSTAQLPAVQAPAVQVPAVQAPVSPRPPILALPSELRNAIYRLALVDNDWITIDENFREPGILQSCRQIRQEARMMWCQRNNFVLPIYNADGALYRAFSRQQLQRISRGDHPIDYYYQFVDQAGKEWSRLMEWCALTHHGKGQFAPLPWDNLDNGRPLPTVVKTALWIAQGLKNLPWPMCQTVFAYYRRIAGFVDSEWLINR